MFNYSYTAKPTCLGMVPGTVGLPQLCELAPSPQANLTEAIQVRFPLARCVKLTTTTSYHTMSIIEQLVTALALLRHYKTIQGSAMT